MTLPDMTTKTGRTMRDAGLALIEQHAGAFVPIMRALALEVYEVKGKVSSDDLRTIGDAIGLAPHHPNVWGCLFRTKGWHVVDVKPSDYPSTREHLIRVWAYGEQ